MTYGCSMRMLARLAARGALLLVAALGMAIPAGAQPTVAAKPGAKIAAPGQFAPSINVNPFPGATVPPGFVVSPGANAGWFVAADSFHDAPNSLKSGAALDNQRADVEVTVTTTDGVVSFARRVSSEPGSDFLRFSIDGVDVAWWSGDVAWDVYSYPVTAGSHVFRWSYQKDGSDNGGEDAAWIDAVVFPEPFTEPNDLTVTIAGTGAGTVTSSPSGIDCGATCEASFPGGTVVTLTATPAAGSALGGWSGACTGTAACQVTMDATQDVTATFVPAASVSRLVNLSARGRVLTGNNVMIGGIVIEGSAAKSVLVRARGPSMIPAGVTDALADPTLTLVNQATGTVIGTNDNWASASNASAIAASGSAPANALESAILMSLAPGAYTAVLSGVNGGVGVGIVEVFEMDAPQVPLANLSTRGRVLTGDNVLIGGFVIDGSGPKTVLLRARGPSMIPAGVADALENPTMTLVRQSTGAVIATNDDFGTAPNLSEIVATGLAPADSRESAILVTLDPGAYTAIVSGVGGGTGVGIVEIFAR